MKGGCAPQTSPYPPDLSWRDIKRRNDTGSSRIPSRLAHRARPIRQYRADAALSRLLPPSPATPGSGCLQLHPAAATARRWTVFHLHPQTAAPRGALEVSQIKDDDPAGQLAVRGDQQARYSFRMSGWSRPCARGGCAPARTAGSRSPGRWQTSPATETCPVPPPRDADDGGDPAPRPGPGSRRPQRLAGLVLEDDPPAEGRRRPFTCGQVSFFHTSMAPSSRSMARRAPIWHDQPRRRSRYQIPGDGVGHPEHPGDQVADAGQRPPLVLVHPAASGPASSTAPPSQLRLIQPDRAAWPLDASAAAPPARHAAATAAPTAH